MHAALAAVLGRSGGTANTALLATSTSRSPHTTHDERKAFLKETNRHRCIHGADPLVWDESIAGQAASFVENMTYMVPYDDPYGLTPPVAENLYWNELAAKPNDAVLMWYSEREHCKWIDHGGCKESVHPGSTTHHFTARYFSTLPISPP